LGGNGLEIRGKEGRKEGEVIIKKCPSPFQKDTACKSRVTYPPTPNTSSKDPADPRILDRVELKLGHAAGNTTLWNVSRKTSWWFARF
jgi:hypothetical protein